MKERKKERERDREKERKKKVGAIKILLLKKAKSIDKFFLSDKILGCKISRKKI